MKYRYCTLLLMLACCSAAAHAQKSGKEITYLPAVEIRDGAVEKEAREVRLTMTVDLSEMRLRTQHTDGADTRARVARRQPGGRLSADCGGR